MKLSWEFKFHGSPLLPLHQATAFLESDSISNKLDWKESWANEIDIALWMASTSALFISIVGMEHENRQMKCPIWFRRTPPIEDRLRRGLKDASTFHFRRPDIGGDHDEGWGRTDFDAWGALQNRQLGFLWISVGEYGNGSLHALIHHPILRRIKSWRLDKELEILLKTRAFLSF